MGTVTKKDLVECIVAHSGQTREAVRMVLESALQSFIDVLSRGDRIEIRDFGVFEVRTRKPRVAQNPKTLEKVKVEARRTVRFKAGRLMKAAVLDGKLPASDAEPKSPAVARVARKAATDTAAVAAGKAIRRSPRSP